MQLNLHDGRNLLLPKEKKDEYRVGDTLKINLETNKIEKVYPYKENSKVMIVKGANRGTRGILRRIVKRKDIHGQKAEVEIENEVKMFPKEFIFVLPEEI